MSRSCRKSKPLFCLQDDNCGKIFIAQSTNVYGGYNVAQVLFSYQSPDGKLTENYSRYPKMTEVLRGRTDENCTFIDIIASQTTNETFTATVGGVILYGTLRYFLWFLMTGKWTTSILLQCNTKMFFHKLRNSKFACFEPAFETPQVMGMGKYFLKEEECKLSCSTDKTMILEGPLPKNENGATTVNEVTTMAFFSGEYPFQGANVTNSVKLLPQTVTDKVVLMQRDCFGTSYDVIINVSETPLNDQTTTQNFMVTFQNGEIFSFFVQYNLVEGKWQLGNNGPFSRPMDGSLRESEVSTGLTLSEDGKSLNMVMNLFFPLPNTKYIINAYKLAPGSALISVEVVQTYSLTVDSTSVINTSRYQSQLSENSFPLVSFEATTDTFLGRNLGEVLFKEEKNCSKCVNCNGDRITTRTLTTVAHTPLKFTNVVSGCGSSLIEKVYYLANRYKPRTLKFDFLRSLIVYGMLRYYLWKLITCKLDITILLKSRTDEFFEELKKSAYAPYAAVFDDPAIKGYGCCFKKHL